VIGPTRFWPKLASEYQHFIFFVAECMEVPVLLLMSVLYSFWLPPYVRPDSDQRRILKMYRRNRSIEGVPVLLNVIYSIIFVEFHDSLIGTIYCFRT
jgi:hypothetical protein